MKIGLPGILFCIFLTLKLTGYIAWSWVWVTAPLWIGFAIFFSAFLFVFGITALGIAAGGSRRARYRF